MTIQTREDNIFAKSEMTLREVRGYYREWYRTYKNVELKDTDYLNVYVEDGYIKDLMVSEIPEWTSGYYPLATQENTHLFFHPKKGEDYFIKQMRKVFLGTFAYGVDMSQDAVVKLLQRVTMKLPNKMNHILDRVKESKRVSQHIKKDVYPIACLEGPDLRQEEFIKYFDRVNKTETLKVYQEISQSGVMPFVQEIQIGRTIDEFEEELTSRVSSLNHLDFYLEDLDEELGVVKPRVVPKRRKLINKV